MGETKEYKLPEEGNTLMVNEPQKNWGGRWTEEKLDAFEKYVKAYLTLEKKLKKTLFPIRLNIWRSSRVMQTRRFWNWSIMPRAILNVLHWCCSTHLGCN